MARLSKQMCIRTNVGTEGSTAKSTGHSVQGKVRETKGARKRRAHNHFKGDTGTRRARMEVASSASGKKMWCLRQVSRMRVAREWGCLDPQCRDQLGNTQTVHWKLEIPSSSPSFSSPRLKKKTICEFKPCRCHARLDLWLNTSDRTVNRRASRQTDACCSGLRRKKKGRKAWLHPWQEKWEPTWPSKRREADVLSHPRLFAGKLNPLLTSKNNRLRSSINSSFSPGDPR